jgi:hypothetical protein
MRQNEHKKHQDGQLNSSPNNGLDNGSVAHVSYCSVGKDNTKHGSKQPGCVLLMPFGHLQTQEHQQLPHETRNNSRTRTRFVKAWL